MSTALERGGPAAACHQASEGCAPRPLPSCVGGKAGEGRGEGSAAGARGHPGEIRAPVQGLGLKGWGLGLAVLGLGFRMYRHVLRAWGCVYSVSGCVPG